MWDRFLQYFGDYSHVIFFSIGIIVRNTLVMYDREHTKVGFWKTNCAELWERLQVSMAPPPMPPNTEAINSTKPVGPTVPSSVSQHNVPPGIKSFSSSI
jgi:hypothetical protein